MSDIYGIQMYSEELVWVVKLLRLLNQCKDSNENCFEGFMEFYWQDMLQGRIVKRESDDTWGFEPVLRTASKPNAAETEG